MLAEQLVSGRVHMQDEQLPTAGGDMEGKLVKNSSFFYTAAKWSSADLQAK